MKKLIVSMALALFVFAMSTTALAAPAAQSASCPGTSSSAASASGANVSKIIENLKSQGYLNGTAKNGQSLQELLKSCGIYIPDASAGTSKAQSGGQTGKTSTGSGSGDSAGTAAPSDSGDKTAASDKTDNKSYEQQVVDLVNEQRAANGLSALTLSEKLSDAARAKSQDMHDKNYFSHTSPTYGSPFDMLKTFGISYKAAGENIAMGQATPEEVVNAWMNSPGHRANILNSAYTQIGVGYVADGSYWTQLFIG
ncbi:uncharacterized protein, YkwD family [Sporobacter termitidis DSM 10068]|uniref:Uncharacterized protein, YkwD family n=1 Tax=Sporobacter termitidis DSM 10068 TaxID=1123282 RepID=A0A1M5ZDJ0_9FIRM|nr:CAP domain-containing protein [Sporobacter termitidis]SHI22268.1 uncharacterized protein, YkwD family [Sporobacter termitidis DSM 10068]